MPAITSGKVLLTGANGYIAVWIVKSLLDAGFSVRGTVRSASKATHLNNLFSSFGPKFETVVVSDMTKAEAFTPYVQDVDAILHTASPFHMNAIEPSEVITPAVQGTLSVLTAAFTHGGTRVQRVVILSSTAALFRAPTSPVVLDESAWNEQSPAEVSAHGREATALAKYRASKTLAERAAWDWYEEKRAGGAPWLGWDLVVLNPPYVFGPALHEVDRPENLGESARAWYFNVVKEGLTDEQLASTGAAFVDVRDIAQAHTLALLKPDAGGNRFIIASGSFMWQDFVSAAHRFSDKIRAGNTSYDPSKATHLLQYNNAKSISTLGITYRSVEDTARDSLEDFKARGWL